MEVTIVSQLCCRRLVLIAEVKVTHPECTQRCTNANCCYWRAPLCTMSVSGALRNWYFCKLIEPCLPDKHGFKLNFSFLFRGGGKEGSSEGSIPHWCNQARERKTKPLQQQVTPKRMVNKAVSRYTGPVLPGLSFSPQILNLTDCWLPAFSQETALKPVRGTCCVYS